VEFLCKQKGFDEGRVRGGVAKIRASKQMSSQTRITNFFQVIKSTDDESPKKSTATTPLKRSNSAIKNKKASPEKKKPDSKVSSPVKKRTAQASIKKPQKKSKK